LPILRRKKAWFFRKMRTGGILPSFVNAKGSCSMRTFDAERGSITEKHYRREL